MKIESEMSVSNSTFSDIIRYENENIYGASIDNSNVGSPIFFNCSLKNMIFDNCDLSNARFFSNCTIEKSKFIRSDLRAVGIGINEAVFNNCEFNSCDMRGMTIENAKFIDCKFLNCKFNDRVLNVNNIINCKFTGKLIDITFKNEASSKLKADFKSCKFDGVFFENCDLSDCIPPSYKDHLYIDDLSKKLKKALVNVAENSKLAEDEKKMLSRFFRKIQGNKQYIFNVSHIEKNYGKEYVTAFLSALEVS